MCGILIIFLSAPQAELLAWAGVPQYCSAEFGTDIVVLLWYIERVHLDDSLEYLKEIVREDITSHVLLHVVLRGRSVTSPGLARHSRVAQYIHYTMSIHCAARVTY